MAVTIYDIAEKLSTTHATVSRGLRNDPQIAIATRERIQKQAKKMGYRPNHLSRALAGGKSMTIGVVGGSFDVRVVAMRLRSIEAAARTQGYVTYVAGWGDDHDRENRSDLTRTVEDLLDRRVDGLIVYHVAPPAELVKVLKGAVVPVVYLDWPLSECAPHSIQVDHGRAFRELAHYAANLGHRKAAYLSTHFGRQFPGHRLNQVCQAMSEAGIELDTSEAWCIPKGGDFELGGYDVIQRQIKQGPVPGLILAANDECAAGVVAGLLDAGLRVPEDVSVVGFDDSLIASLYRPALTTIHQPRGEVGAAAFKMLHKLMSNSKGKQDSVVFESDLVIRQSTGAVATGGPSGCSCCRLDEKRS